MKILFFIESLRAGGKERRIVELLKGLKHYKDISIDLVLTRNEIHYQEVFQLGVPIHIIERKFLKKDPQLFFKFFRLVKKIKPDIIHVWGHMVAVYAVPTKWWLNIPLINNEITDSTPNQFLLGKSIVFKVSDRIIANSEAGLIAYGAPTGKSGVIYNGFNFERLRAIEDAQVVRDRFGIKSTFVVAMVASFLNYKDWGTYIKAAHQVLEHFDDVTFLCVGDGDDSAYRNSVSGKGIGKILFLGKQSRVESIMNICNVGVLTTNTNFHGEGISNALMEFMALGKPVIATNFGGSVELIEPNVSGYLIDAFSDTQLSEKILHLLKDKNECSQMGEQALKRVQEKFSIEGMVRYFYEEYMKFASKR
jgi:glycosyltransferase involved in cell wall biosynthesis